MHGIIFTSFRHFIRSRLGAPRASELLAGERPHSITEAYDDHEFLRLFGRVADAIGGTARHFGERASVEEIECLRRGDRSCLFEARFERVNGART